MDLTTKILIQTWISKQYKSGNLLCDIRTTIDGKCYTLYNVKCLKVGPNRVFIESNGEEYRFQNDNFNVELFVNYNDITIATKINGVMTIYHDVILDIINEKEVNHKIETRFTTKPLKSNKLGGYAINGGETIIAEYPLDDKKVISKLRGNTRIIFHNLGRKCSNPKCNREYTKIVLLESKDGNRYYNLYDEDDVLFTLDHILPKSKGGSKRNMINHQTMCATCNNRKGNRVTKQTREEYRRKLLESKESVIVDEHSLDNQEVVSKLKGSTKKIFHMPSRKCSNTECNREYTKIVLIKSHGRTHYNLYDSDNTLFTLNFITPKSKGGLKNDKNNHQVMCQPCSRKKCISDQK